MLRPMSTPEDPTRRMPPAEPEGAGAPPRSPGGPGEREQVVEREAVVDDDAPFRAHVADQLRSMRNALVGIGIISLLALGLAGWALLADDDEDGGDRNAASRSQVRDLEDRVDRLESQMENAAGENEVSELSDAQSQLADRVNTLEGAQDDTDGPSQQDVQQLRQAIDDLSSDIQELGQRVDEVEQEQQQQQQP
jgi:outer membrane murein-binding lipoprotein Lpp